MRIRRVLPPLLLVGVLVHAAPARAGGWDSLEFPKRQYVVGEVASAQRQFFAGELEETGSLDGGPYYAYLLTDSRDELFGMIDPPTIPRGAIFLGALSVSGPVIAGDGYPYGVASLSFRVPDVPSGHYSIGFCDDPCAHSTIGWLALGRITIVHTPYEGALLHRIVVQDRRIWNVRQHVRRAERTADDLRAELADVQTELRALTRPRVGATTPAELRSAGPIVEVARTPTPSVTWWIALLAGLVGLVAGLAIGRRRSEPKLVIPDTVPDDLERREPALPR